MLEPLTHTATELPTLAVGLGAVLLDHGCLALLVVHLRQAHNQPIGETQELRRLRHDVAALRGALLALLGFGLHIERRATHRSGRPGDRTEWVSETFLAFQTRGAARAGPGHRRQ